MARDRKRPLLADVDSAESAFRLKAFTWSLAGLVLGVLLGLLISIQRGTAPIRTMVISGLALWLFSYAGSLLVAERMGRWGGGIYFSGTSRLPQRREYSLGEALAARGRCREAADEYERNAAAFREDPEPCMRLARLLRDELGQPDAAVTWYREALRRAAPGSRVATQRELVELFVHRLATPEKALPELARIAAEHDGTPTADWARGELRRIKAQLPGDG
jgi:tetratricopeptide (TPR) repeat protein